MAMNKASSLTATLIVGCGYLGKRVALAELRQSPGRKVYATTRSPEKAEQFAAQGIVPIIADWTDRRTLAKLPPCDRVLVAVSYDRRGRLSRDESQVGGLSHLLDFVSPEADICYISTTGVYHQTGGLWVDENSPARARAEGGVAHLRAESLLHKRRPYGLWTILRLAGIYGPDRIPRVADVIHGRPIEGPHGGYLNLIHVDDAADAVLAAWDLATSDGARRERLYAVADDRPIIRRAFYEEIARLARVAAPIFTTQGNDSPAAVLSSRSASNKRIWNRRFRRALMPRLTYRDYIDGLAALDFGNHGSRS